MVTILTGLAINSDVDAERTPPLSFRQILASLFDQTAAGEPVPGIIPAPGTPLLVTGHPSAMQYLVKAGWAVTTRPGKGAYIVGSIDDLVIPATPAHSTFGRIDRIYIVQPDPELAEAGLARVDVITGVPSSNPVLPDIPTGALELGRKIIGAGQTNTSIGQPFTNLATKTKLNLSSILAASISDQQNIDAGKIRGKKIDVISTGIAPSGPAVGDVWVDYS